METDKRLDYYCENKGTELCNTCLWGKAYDIGQNNFSPNNLWGEVENKGLK